MKSFTEKLRRAYQLAYDMKPYKGLSIYPKILQEKPLSKFSKEEKENLTRKGFRWYIYFSYLNPETKKFERQPPVSGDVNRDYPDFDKRYKAIHRLLNGTKELLEDGESPFDVAIEDGEVVTMAKALDFALEAKKITISKDTYDSYEVRANQFREFLKKKGLLHRDTFSFNFKVVRDFLREIAKTTSVANRNNVLRALKSLFSVMHENDLIRENYVAKIKMEKTDGQRFLSYSHKQAVAILEYLEKEDPVMALFLKFIGFNFLRPKEVVRLTAGDIDLEDKTLSVFVKQGKYKKKRIPEEIFKELKQLDLSKKNLFLFHKDKLLGEWKRDEKGRRNYYSQRYIAVKKKLGYGEGYTMYSFRHTYITIGFKNLRKRLSKDAAIEELMRYTGHDSRDALKGYIHYHDIDIVDEYQGEIK